MKLFSTDYTMFLDSMVVEKHLQGLEDAYYEASTAEDAKTALWRLEAARALVEALRKASEEVEFLKNEGLIEA